MFTVANAIRYFLGSNGKLPREKQPDPFNELAERHERLRVQLQQTKEELESARAYIRRLERQALGYGVQS